MDVRPTITPPLERMFRRYGKTASRFLMVSAFNGVFGQSLLVLSHSWLGWSFAVSNGVAVAISACPASLLSQR